MVYIEKRHLEICSTLADELNRVAKRFKQKNYKLNLNKYERLLVKKDISVEEKKKEIINAFHNLLIKTFSIDIKKITSKKGILALLKDNINVLRRLVIKLRDINYYLENTLLEELKLVKKRINLGDLKDKDIKKLIEGGKKYLGKKEIEKLEHTVYKLIEKIIFLDQRLLKKYKLKEEKIIKKEKTEIRNIEGILKRESELLCHLEAKLPPPLEIKARLLRKAVFTEWLSRIIALIAAFENEYRKEKLIFKKLKRNRKIKKKMDTKIKHLIKEKWELLRLKEKRLLSMEEIIKIDAEHQNISHNYSSVLRL